MNRSARPCPICGRPPDESVAPFCSKRCADIDLGRWFTGQYRVPGESAGDDGEAADGEVDPRDGSG